jgi:hypothetical protein
MSLLKGQDMSEHSPQRQFRIKSELYSVSREQILAVASREPPRKINAYFVEIDSKRYPPKQLVRAATGTKQFFDTPAAVRILTALGFAVHTLSGDE